MSMTETTNPYSYKWTMHPGTIPLNFGDMDYAPDPAIVAAITERLAWPLAYPPPYTVSGVASVLAAYYQRRHGLSLPAEAFWLATGCLTQSYHVLASLVGAGDEVLYWTPAFFHIPSAITAAGAVPVPAPLPSDRDLTRADIEPLISPATRVIYLVNPHNPTGKVYTAPELRAICEVAADHDLVVVSNELHSRVILDGEHQPFAALSPTAAQISITLSGASKSHNLAGLGGAFAFSANAELLRRAHEPARHRCPAATGLQQAALATAYADDSPWLRATTQRIKTARDLACATLKHQLPQLGFPIPSGTYFLWVDFAPYLRRGESAVDALRERCAITAKAGTAFGGKESQARLSLATQKEILRQALTQMVQGLTGSGRE
ncbi:aminotransferase class I/II-fold pyridoxal phosphate-dependent enzyme [Planomonospora parontospora]|uniref:aminotransferase class I/II-fold pyridoxal phosphate-dependent enzyme n=1 Tax=Planomonospora parontospora TaxID=58119 RepID=UPI0016714451|nr:pyridoxal phosphate-dependent aminotransferase [Planomonospora parontospora]GGL54843.1 aminotransferase [Planomonospora parontospora subsp. antibiotica]GII19281.1 aminotransferase [Planomonospora parontospora subsp. antibiotica]